MWNGDDHEKEIALRLMGECGLRTQEMLSVTPDDVSSVETESGTLTKVRIPSGKGDKFRETTAPDRLADLLRMFERGYGVEQDAPYVDRSRRTIQRWVEAAGEHTATRTGESAYEQVTAHDLRRSWAMVLLDSGTAPTVVMTLGGWENYTTFREHHMMLTPTKR